MTDVRVIDRYHTQLRKLRNSLRMGSTFLVRSIQPSGKIELILTVKMETRHSVGGPVSREISAFVIIVEL